MAYVFFPMPALKFTISPHFKIIILGEYSYNRMKRHGSLFMKQNCLFDRGLAQYKHATPPLRFSGIITTLLGFPKRYITLVYLKGLKSCQ